MRGLVRSILLLLFNRKVRFTCKKPNFSYRTGATLVVFLYAFCWIGIAPVDASSRVRVIEVLDTDVITVQSIDGTTRTVKIAGITSDKSPYAYQYTLQTLLSKEVYVISRSKPQNGALPQGWIYGEVLYGPQNTSYGVELIIQGYAQISDDHHQYFTEAQINQLYDIQYDRYVININTASEKQLKNIFYNNATLVRQIMQYRRQNPFNQIDEIKRVTGMSKEIFDTTRKYLSVCTNVNTASKEELDSLIDITDKEVRAILSYQRNKKISSIDDLYTIKDISRRTIDKNKEYLCVKNQSFVYLDQRAININTASMNEMLSTGQLSNKQAEKIVEWRMDGTYMYRTLEEIIYISDINLSFNDLIDLESYMHVVTDINQASKNELMSLFGISNMTEKQKQKIAEDIIKYRPFTRIQDAKRYIGDEYERVSKFIYVNEYVPSAVININTAHYTDLQSFLGVSEPVAKGIYKYQGKYKNSKNINVKAYEDIIYKIGLYTNINTAHKEELLLLSPQMNGSIVNKIVEYRNDQIFATHDEVRQFFNEHHLMNIYMQIRNYITVM